MTWIEYSGRVDHLAADHGYTGCAKHGAAFVEQISDDFGVPSAFTEGQDTACLYDIVQHLARILRPAVKSELRTGYRSFGGSFTWRTRLARAD